MKLLELIRIRLVEQPELTPPIAISLGDFVKAIMSEARFAGEKVKVLRRDS